MIAATGWRWSDIDELTWAQLMALLRYYRKHPPVHILLQGLTTGMSGVTTSVSHENNEPSAAPRVTDVNEFMSMIQQAGVPIGVIQDVK